MKKKKQKKIKIETSLTDIETYIKEEDGIKYKVIVTRCGNVMVPLETWESMPTKWVKSE